MSDKIPFLLGGFLQLPQPISNYFHLNLSITIKLMESKEPQNKKEKALNEAVDILAQIFVDLLDNRKLLDDNIHKYHYDGERKREK